MKYIAHKDQSLIDHLQGVADKCRGNADKIGCGDYGELLGLLHDLGKYSIIFQNYIRSAVDDLDPDQDEEFINTSEYKGKIDHSTSGAQFLWRKLAERTVSEKFLAQILSLCLVSHHSGLIDCLHSDNDGTVDSFTRRIEKGDEKTHFHEVTAKAEILDRVSSILSDPAFSKPMERILKSVFSSLPCGQKNHTSTLFQFQAGLFVRFLFSCLVDADRQDTADSEKIWAAGFRQNGKYVQWKDLIDRLETRIREFGAPGSDVNRLRKHVSDSCLEASQNERNIFTLTVPTGGGKTLASLRFALHHAEKHELDRIIFILPFTSIIDQNAEVVRNVLEQNAADKGRIVLEHHSNIGAEKQSWKEKLLTENWDAPVVYTTMVQFLEALFGAGTRGARRMHQLAKAVIVFDEIQTLPIRCVHMFCNAVNFLVNQCGSSVVMCTATQPLLGKVNNQKGSLDSSLVHEIMPDVDKLFGVLKRVNVIDSRKAGGWAEEETADLVLKEVKKTGSCLVVVNMKRSARSLFKIVQGKNIAKCFHLSTGMCPAHRKKVLSVIRERVKQENNLPTICISTQLIEAGVDVDFGTVVRYIAGLDSIAQAAGRCNRNGRRSIGKVYVVNPKDEPIDCLKDIAIAQEKAGRVLDDYKEDPGKYRSDLIGPSLLEWYYKNYFFVRRNEMDYPVTPKEAGRNDTILNLLSTNHLALSSFARSSKKKRDLFLYQSFMTAGELFAAIDAPTIGIVVQYGEKGKELVEQLCSAFEVEKQYRLLREVQQYSVNVFPHEFKRLSEAGALFPVQSGTKIWFLDERYYSEEFGISMEPISEEGLLYG